MHTFKYTHTVGENGQVVHWMCACCISKRSWWIRSRSLNKYTHARAHRVINSSLEGNCFNETSLQWDNGQWVTVVKMIEWVCRYAKESHCVLFLVSCRRSCIGVKCCTSSNTLAYVTCKFCVACKGYKGLTCCFSFPFQQGLGSRPRGSLPSRSPTRPALRPSKWLTRAAWTPACPRCHPRPSRPSLLHPCPPPSRTSPGASPRRRTFSPSSASEVRCSRVEQMET